MPTDERLSIEKSNAAFDKECKKVYKEIDKQSDLMWSMKNENELIRRQDNRQKTRGAIGADTKKEDG